MATEEKTTGMDVFRAFLWLVKLIFAIIMIVVGLGLFMSCSSTSKDDGTIKVADGTGKMISIPYQILGEITSIQIDKSEIEFYAKLGSIPAKNICKYELTYTPLNIMVYENDDKIITACLEFSAQNAYGVPGVHKAFVKFKDGKHLNTDVF